MSTRRPPLVNKADGGTSCLIAAVGLGLAVAASQLPAAWPVFRDRAYWRLSATERVAPACLAVAHVGVAVVPIVAADGAG